LKLDFEKPITAPVLFLVFNRPDKTQQVFDVIRSVKPKKYYVAADAPREDVPGDYEKCKKVRSIVSQIDWDCDAKFMFHEKNLGCSLAGVTAWNWLFSKENEMIFLEDDGVPSRSFFLYCQELLKKYEDNLNIGHICGMNYGKKYGNATYFFTRYGGGTYGLATWKRTHDLYEYKLESYKKIKKLKSFKNRFLYHFEYKLWTRRFEDYIKRGGNTYDLQIGYMMYKYNLFSIMPNINMITNIGFDLDASNTKISPNSKGALKYGNLPRYELDEIIHPDKFEIDKEFEKQQLMHRMFQDKSKAQAMLEAYLPFIARVIRKLMRIAKHVYKCSFISH
jgi:hypothetical protein